MVSKNLKSLILQKKVLQARAAQEREALALHFEPLKKPLSWVNKGFEAYRFMKDTPFLWTSAFALLVHFQPKVASKLLAVGWSAMKLLRSAKRLI
jgi:hypothetical protein